MDVPGAVDTALKAFGVWAPAAETRRRLEQWLTDQRADPRAWRDWGFINLITLVLLSPDVNLA